tara:strand:+ start:87 stop:509 length:423 start_codon:yes stop_codon:yes gene_type:complete
MKGNVEKILEGDKNLNSLLKAVRNLILLNKNLIRIIDPPLSHFVTVSLTDGGIPVLVTKNSATATKLKQSQNYIVRHLKKIIPRLTEIKIIVNPHNESTVPKSFTVPKPKFEGKAAFDDLSKKLSRGDLKKTIDRIRSES